MLLENLTTSIIRLYQKTRILRAPSCRFYPSCSEYMAQYIEQHGLFRGLTAGLVRLAKCHPWHAGGLDEVPERTPRILDKTR